MDPETNSHAMPSTQSPPIQPHSINLSQFEMSIAQTIEEKSHGRWSCKRCNTIFDSIMRVVTHALTSCDEDASVTTFSNKSAIHLCMVFDEPGSEKMLETFNRLAEDDTESEVDHEQNEDVKSEERTRPPRNQEFPATPPASLSADQKAEWTFRRDRAEEIRHIMKTSLQQNRAIDKALAVATWNSSSHPKSWKSNDNADPYKSYNVLVVRESRDREQLRKLTEKAEKAQRR